ADRHRPRLRCRDPDRGAARPAPGRRAARSPAGEGDNLMGPGETIALVAIVGGLIAVTILVGTIFKRIMSYKEKQLGLTADRTAEKAAQYASHVEQLAARLTARERIATDKGADLALQIEELREPPKAGLPLAERTN